MLRYHYRASLLVIFSLVFLANGWTANPIAGAPSCCSELCLYSDLIERSGKLTRIAAEKQRGDSSVLSRNNDGLDSSINPTFSGTEPASPLPIKPPASEGNSWVERIRQLIEFKQVNGHTLVPRRYKENPSLGNWVNKQRQHYRNYRAGTKPCSLNESRIEMLNQLGFCWDASPVASIKHQHTVHEESSSSESNRFLKRQRALPDTHWWDRFRELQTLVDHQQQETSSSGVTGKTHAIPRNSSLGQWLQRQRRSSLPPHKMQALRELDPDWSLTPREFQWECRYRELQEYAKKHDDCCVPISHPNKPLANWVSTQRKQYNLRQQRKPSDMSLERLERLNEIDFAWNRWEYEFARKQKKWSHGAHES